ncbi:HpcH/HpaI aldolase/citrate lyase family protein [Blastomonas fulva]|uniref:HpcH/HpaI aldolase/citrate lyase family protein n=1 Tax=Blastomonas fulva TaxID=1550728 RepID=UPI0025A4365B|nr:CoA ester lyase [Blastomonas fulva]MDM7927072.1 CoA ester lyase [Blastomonas fulva]MDM7966934.1 CoA ester lyase [Blastomonas fulva]
MTHTVRPRRSALYMPASNPRALAKARSLPADVIILDLEDAVAPEAKADARDAAIAAAAEGGFGNRELAIRINALDTPWGKDDLAAVAHAQIDAVLIPKVYRPTDITACNAALADAPSRLQLWAMIETCAVVPHLDALAALSAGTRLSLFVMGVNDLAKEMRAKLTPERTPFLPILTLAVAAARAHNVAILDGVCNEFRDLDVFSAEADQGLLFGFDGKTLIHPDQIGPCNAVFSPSADELARAQAVIAAFDLPENAGKGAIRVDGRMVELLHLEQARQTVAIARQIAAQG